MTWFDKFTIMAINDLRKYFKDEYISISKAFNSHVCFGEDTREIIYHLYISGVCCEDFNDINGLISKLSKIVAERNPEYRKRLLIREHNWDELYKENA